MRRNTFLALAILTVSTICQADQINVAHTDSNTTVPIELGNSFLVSSSHRPVHIMAHDMDKNFYPDLVSVSLEDDKLRVWRNNGDASFSVLWEYLFLDDDPPIRVTIEDVDQDTNPDIAVNMFSPSGNVIYLFFGTEDGNYSEVQSFPSTRRAWGTKFIDLNNDGYLDILGFLSDITRFDQYCPKEFIFRSTQSASISSAYGLYFHDQVSDSELTLVASQRGRFFVYDYYTDQDLISHVSNEVSGGPDRFLHKYDLNKDGYTDYVGHATYALSTGPKSFEYSNLESVNLTGLVTPYITEAADIDLDGTVEVVIRNHYVDFDHSNMPIPILYTFEGSPLPSGNSLHVTTGDLDLDGDTDLVNLARTNISFAGNIIVYPNLLLDGTTAPYSRAIPLRPSFAGGDITGSLVTFQHDVDTTTSLYVRTIAEPWHEAGTIVNDQWSYTPEFGSGKYYFQAVSSKLNTFVGEEIPHGRFGFPESFAIWSEGLDASFTNQVCCDDLDYEFPLDDFVSATLRPYDLQTTGTVTASLSIEPKPATKGSAKGTNSAPVISILETDVTYTSATLSLEFSPSDYPNPLALQTLMFDDESTSSPVPQSGTIDPENPWRIFVTVTESSGNWFLESVPAGLESFEILEK